MIQVLTMTTCHNTIFFINKFLRPLTGGMEDAMNKKYNFTGETKEHDSVTLHEICAVIDFGNVKAGDIGGWIEKEENLSHDGNSWVYGDAIVDEDFNCCT